MEEMALKSITVLQKIHQMANLSNWTIDKNTWSLKRSRPLEIYTVFVILTALGVLMYGLWAYDSIIKTYDEDVSDTVDFIQLVGIRIAHIVSITEALVKRKDQKIFFEQLHEIDKIFQRSLNVDLENEKFSRNTLKSGIGIFCVYLIAECFILINYVFSEDDQEFYIYWIFYIYPILICGLRYFQIFTEIRILKTRFKKLIDILQNISLEDMQKDSAPAYVTSVELSRKTNGTPYSQANCKLHRLLIIRDVYNRLFNLIEIMNHFFGFSMLTLVANDFFAIISNFFWTFINIENFTTNGEQLLEIAITAVWSVPHIMNLLTLVILCERIMQSNSSIALGLHRIQIDTLNDNQNSVIQQFSLQLLHQKISISAAGFFNIDCSLLYKIVGATTTYLIILIQFHISAGPDN